MNFKMLKKIYFFLLFLLVIIAVAFSAYIFWKKSQLRNADNRDGNTVSAPALPSVPVSNLNETSAELRKSGKLLYQNERGYGYMLKETEEYSILMFDEKEISFLISLNVINNVPEIRSMAEDDFLKILNISKDEACQLKVSLSVPKEASTTQIGVDYGLSFCPNGISFEP